MAGKQWDQPRSDVNFAGSTSLSFFGLDAPWTATLKKAGAHNASRTACPSRGPSWIIEADDELYGARSGRVGFTGELMRLSSPAPVIFSIIVQGAMIPGAFDARRWWRTDAPADAGCAYPGNGVSVILCKTHFHFSYLSGCVWFYEAFFAARRPDVALVDALSLDHLVGIYT